MKPKISGKSFGIAKTKFKRDLEGIIGKIDKANTRKLNFNMIGELMHLLGIYKILYNEKHGIHSRPTTSKIKCDELCNHSSAFLLRQRKENEFHFNFWKLLTITNDEYVETSIIISLFSLIYDSTNISQTALINQIDCIICSF